MKGVIFVIVWMHVLLHGNVIEHLKSASNKGSNHSMQNIDFIYLINLDKRPEKYEMCCEQLHPYEIYPYRFSAVNGWELPIDVIEDVGLKFQPGMKPIMSTTFRREAGGISSNEFMTEYGRAYFRHCMSRGAIGCYLSHISVLQDAYDSGYKTIWILEDDIEVLDDPNKLSIYIEMLDELLGEDGWDVLYTDRDYRSGVNQYVEANGACQRPDMDCSIAARLQRQYVVKRDISPDFREVSARFGTHSMIIRRSGIKKLLEFVQEHSIYLPIDLENYLVPGIRRFSLRYDLVTNMLGAMSDNGRPNYKDED